MQTLRVPCENDSIYLVGGYLRLRETYFRLMGVSGLVEGFRWNEEVGIGLHFLQSSGKERCVHYRLRCWLGWCSCEMLAGESRGLVAESDGGGRIRGEIPGRSSAVLNFSVGGTNVQEERDPNLIGYSRTKKNERRNKNTIQSCWVFNVFVIF